MVFEGGFVVLLFLGIVMLGDASLCVCVEVCVVFRNTSSLGDGFVITVLQAVCSVTKA